MNNQTGSALAGSIDTLGTHSVTELAFVTGSSIVLNRASAVAFSGELRDMMQCEFMDGT